MRSLNRIPMPHHCSIHSVFDENVWGTCRRWPKGWQAPAKSYHKSSLLLKLVIGTRQYRKAEILPCSRDIWRRLSRGRGVRFCIVRIHHPGERGDPEVNLQKLRLSEQPAVGSYLFTPHLGVYADSVCCFIKKRMHAI